MHWWKIIMEKPAGRRCSVALRWKTYMYCRIFLAYLVEYIYNKRDKEKRCLI